MIESLPSDRSIEITIRARYAETDAMGVVHHASYVVWLEQGRTELLRALGVSYREIEATGFFVVLSDLRVRYHASARYDDLVRVVTTLEQVRSRGVSFLYEVRRVEEDGSTTKLVSARTALIAIDREGTPRTMPPALLEAFRAATEQP